MKRLYFYICLSFLLCGCVQDVEIYKDISDVPVVMTCVLENGPQQKLRLEYLYDLLGNARGDIQDADARLYKCDSNIIEVAKFEKSSSGIWETLYVPENGARYRITVKIDGKPELTAETRYPEKFSIQTHTIANTVGLNLDLYHEAGLTFISEIMDGFQMRVESENDCVLWFYSVNSDTEGGDYIFNNITTNHLLVDDFNATSYFYTSHCQSDKSYIGLPLYDTYLRIDCPLDYDNGERKMATLDTKYSVGGNGEIDNVYYSGYEKKYFAIAGEFDNGWPSSSYIMAVSVSEEYDAYLKEMIAKSKQGENELMSLYTGHNVYTNVINGAGVFGAVVSKKMSLLKWSALKFENAPLPQL